ncbi:hypothetical protein MLD38_004618 [Melastoma candidum]|uniref:Uncharacterized protein n=1 Tax=Melastoma candidum TaxID=119954 RepID=A0ACB9S6P0_9MYRT|nr:hypothetical protein MLD38_004618 [Melastoma candidum]
MWKYLKKNDNETHVVAFLNYLSSCLSDIVWNPLDDIISLESITDKRVVWVQHFGSNIDVQRPELTFLGYLYNCCVQWSTSSPLSFTVRPSMPNCFIPKSLV